MARKRALGKVAAKRAARERRMRRMEKSSALARRYGLTPAEVARACGESPATVWRALEGRYVPRKNETVREIEKAVWRLAKALLKPTMK